MEDGHKTSMFACSGLFRLCFGAPPAPEAIITGEKRCSLAITEPHGGSDVANVATTAVKEQDVYVVNGQKTFISGGIHADYFTTGVRTGGCRPRG